MAVVPTSVSMEKLKDGKYVLLENENEIVSVKPN